MRIRHFLVLAAVTLFVAFGPPERTSPAKWALVVGISDYTHFGDEVGGDLPGAANDARAIADVLVNKYDFAPGNVKLILDGAATRARLESEWTEWLPSVARPGDLVWFYFAGHGSQAWDLDGDEEDGLDETVCPADVTRGNTDMDILDDEIGQWLDQLPTDNVIVVWDKCHAKSSTRAVTPFARPRSLDRNVKEDVAKPEGATEGRTTAAAEDGGPSGSGVLEIASAQADEVAIDAAFPSKQGGDPTYGGAFTTPFVQNMWNATDEATYEEVFNQTKGAMRRNRFRQEPAIDDKSLKDRPLFWVDAEAEAGADEPEAVPGATSATAPVKGTVRILELPSETQAILAGGFNADITARSIYTAGDEVLEVTRVDPDRAEARVTTRETRGIGVSREGEMAVGSRARLVAYRYPDAMLQVMVADLPGRVQAGLRSELVSVPSLVLVTDPTAFSHLLVRPRNDHYVVLNLDGFPRDSVAASDEAAEELASLLKREFGQFQLTELENPGQPFDVDFTFGSGGNEFRLGETVSFRVVSDREGYLTIVDLAPDGTVSVIFPNEYVAENRVYANRPTEFPTPDMNLQFTAIEPVGRGVVRTFVTERPLVMPFAQGADAAEAERIWQALRNAAGRSPIQGSDAIPVHNWATSAIVYEIRR
ncbi:MAG: caspase family protein [Longimicrobiales bacterium]